MTPPAPSGPDLPLGIKKRCYAVPQSIKVFCFTLPNDQDPPSHFLKALPSRFIPLYIPGQFWQPVVLAGMRDTPFPAAMLMPEAAVNKNYRPSRSEH